MPGKHVAAWLAPGPASTRPRGGLATETAQLAQTRSRRRVRLAKQVSMRSARIRAMISASARAPVSMRVGCVNPACRHAPRKSRWIRAAPRSGLAPGAPTKKLPASAMATAGVARAVSERSALVRTRSGRRRRRLGRWDRRGIAEPDRAHRMREGTARSVDHFDDAEQ